MGTGYPKIREIKEKRLIGQPKLLTMRQYRVIANQQSKSLCQIISEERKATGFLCLIPYPVLITNNCILNEEQIKPGKDIKICFKDENDDIFYKKIKIDETRTTYTVGKVNDEEINTTIIELRPDDDNLNGQEFIEIDDNLMVDDINVKYETKYVYLIHYKENEEIAMSTGVINKVIKHGKFYSIFHTCDSDYYSYGSPILLYNNKVIGIHRGAPNLVGLNVATLLQYPILEYIKKLKQKKDFDKENKINISIKHAKNKTNIQGDSDEKNKITVIYKKNKEENGIKVLGKIFVENNKENFKLLINEKKYDISEYIKYDDYGINKNDDLLIITFNEIKTKKVTDLSYMFYGCKLLISLDLKAFNTENILNMQSMFEGCSDMTSLDLKTVNTEKVTNMAYMFVDCTSLTTVDLSSLNTINVKTMRSMFNGCSSLTNVNLSSFNTQNVTTMECMFGGCSSLTNVNLSSFNTINNTNVQAMFAYCSSLTTLDLTKFNTQNVTNMQFMFAYCSSLVTLDLKAFNSQNVTTMESMFSGCSSLKKLSLSSLNTKNVNTMECMFSGCCSLENLDLSSFNIQNVTSMYCMFLNCSSLKKIKLFSFKTQNVDNIEGMFWNCSSLTEIDLSSFDTKNVKNMKRIFCNCSNLTIVNLKLFNTDEADIENVFYGCKELKSCGCKDNNIRKAFIEK